MEKERFLKFTVETVEGGEILWAVTAETLFSLDFVVCRICQVRLERSIESMVF
jgi:hypothetical protein